MTIGEKIRLHRKGLGLTQTELGEKLGVKMNAVSKWECGRVGDIPTAKIKALARLFGVTPSYLIGDDRDVTISASPSLSPCARSMDDFGERIYNLRKSRGLTLEQVGQAVGVGRSTVRKWEKGIIANMRRDKIKKLASALGTTPSYMMGWTDDPVGDSFGCSSPAMPAWSPALKALAESLGVLNEEGREKLAGYAADLVASGRYINRRE